MNSKVLAGAFAAILLTASVVVGFLNHAAYNAQKSIHRGRRQSLNHGALSAGSSDYIDLSSVLESAKSEMGMSTTPSAASIPSVAEKVEKVAETASTVVTSAPVVPEPVTSAATTAVKAATTAATDGSKAPTLAEFVKKSVDGSGPPTGVTSDWSSTKAGLNLLRDNTIRFAGKDPADVPEINLPDVSAGYNKIASSLPQVSLKDVAEKAKNMDADDIKAIAEKAKNIDVKSINFDVPKFSLSEIEWPSSYDAASLQQFFDHLPQAAKTYAAVGAGLTLFLITAASKPKETPPPATKEVDTIPQKVTGLTDELGTLQTRMKVLEATGADLDSQLTEAKTKLTEKELDISKARLDAADKSLSLQREIDMLKLKLVENDGKVKSLDAELTKARDECADLVKELEKGKVDKVDEAKQVADEAAKLAKMKKEAEAAKKKEAEEARKMTLAAAKRADEEAKKKKAAPKKKTVAKVEELPTADTPKKAAAPKKKAAPKKAPAKKAPAKKAADTKDLTTLTKSALSRTTVKVLVEFLESKGIETVDENGKTKKKADLIAAVDSL